MTRREDKGPVAPMVWPLVLIAGQHMNQSDEQDRPDEGGAAAGRIIDAIPDLMPTDPREVGAMLLALHGRLEDLASLVYRQTPDPRVPDEQSEQAGRMVAAMQYGLARAAAVLWQADGWSAPSDRVFAHYTAMEDRRKIHADLIAAGLPSLPAALLSDDDGKGGAS